jgi:hypothetical protein
VQGDLRENKGKFADLRKANADKKGGPQGIAEEADYAGPDNEFSGENHRHEDGN